MPQRWRHHRRSQGAVWCFSMWNSPIPSRWIAHVGYLPRDFVGGPPTLSAHWKTRGALEETRVCEWTSRKGNDEDMRAIRAHRPIENRRSRKGNIRESRYQIEPTSHQRNRRTGLRRACPMSRLKPTGASPFQMSHSCQHQLRLETHTLYTLKEQSTVLFCVLARGGVSATSPRLWPAALLTVAVQGNKKTASDIPRTLYPRRDQGRFHSSG